MFSAVAVLVSRWGCSPEVLGDPRVEAAKLTICNKENEAAATHCSGAASEADQRHPPEAGVTCQWESPVKRLGGRACWRDGSRWC